MLETIDLTLRLDREAYVRELTRHQIELRELGYQIYLQERPVVIVFEGWDAAGKGGAIKRITERLDPRAYSVYPISAPHGDEKTKHYLYRFWKRLPENGQIAIFDRSWYGRVLVERVEGFCSEKEWRRAYDEINDFERALTDDGAIIVKVYLHITKEEQLFRFKRREADPMKHWKINEEDWRNRKHWPEHNQAAEEMFERTSTKDAPWSVVPANYKWFARVKTLKTVVEAIEKVKLKKRL